MRKHLTSFLLLLFLSVSAHSRWVNLEESSVNVLLDKRTINVDKEGKSIAVFEKKYKILNEQGRQSISSYQLYYNGNANKIKILEAFTVYQGKQYNVLKDSIEDKPIASDANGFDQTRQILISFPKAEIGAEIYLKYSINTFRIPFKETFSKIFWLDDSGCTSNFVLDINSKIPLNIKINDPNNKINHQFNKLTKLNEIHIELASPICQELMPNSEIGVINDNKYTWVLVSSINTWKELAIKLNKRYQEVIDQPLPGMFQAILDEALLIKEEVAQINQVTAAINDKIRYMGSWSTIEGGYFPRDLAKLAAVQEADCKEFASILAAILNKLDYKVNIAFVERGEGIETKQDVLPNIDAFNHVILRLVSSSGKTYWLDPTNIVAMAQGIFPDIAGKMALVIGDTSLNYEAIPNINQENAIINLVDEVTHLDQKVNHSGSLFLSNEMALDYTGASLFQPEESTKNYIYRSLSGKFLSEKNKKRIILPDLSSRIVKDLAIKFEYEVEYQTIKTNIAPAFKIDAEWADDLIDFIPDQLSSLYIGPSRTYHKKILFKDYNIPNIEKLNFMINTPWVKIKRKCYKEAKNSIIDLTVIYKGNFIKSEELKSKEYLNLKQAIEENIQNVAVIRVND